MLQILQNALIPALLAGISLYALCKGVDVFPTFLRGAAVGLKTAVPVSYTHLDVYKRQMRYSPKHRACVPIWVIRRW